jgi:hypothetical protein
VFSAAIVPSGRKLSVLAAPIWSAAALALSASARAAALCGNVTFAPTNPAGPSARTISANSAGGAGRRW